MEASTAEERRTRSRRSWIALSNNTWASKKINPPCIVQDDRTVSNQDFRAASRETLFFMVFHFSQRRHTVNRQGLVIIKHLHYLQAYKRMTISDSEERLTRGLGHEIDKGAHFLPRVATRSRPVLALPESRTNAIKPVNAVNEARTGTRMIL